MDDEVTMRIANRTARWALLIGLVAALPMLAACNTLKGAAKGVESIGSGLQKDVEKVEQEVTN
jgi:predicted small secreted protein